MSVVCTTTTIPGIPPTPATVISSLRLGWDASAISKSGLFGDGKFSFSVGVGSQGVIAGLAENFTGKSYREIQFGFSASNRTMFVMEFGERKTPDFVVNGATVQIWRLGGVVSYYIGNNRVYTSEQSNSALLFAAAMLYSGGDTIANAEFINTSSESGNCSAQLQSLAGQSGWDVATCGAHLLFQPLKTKVWVGGGTEAHDNYLAPLVTFCGIGEYCNSSTQLQPLTVNSGVEASVADMSLSVNALPYLHTIVYGAAHPLTRITAMLKPLVAVSADHAFGYSANYFQAVGNMAGEGIRIDGLAQLTLTGRYTLDAQATLQPLSGLSATLPMLAMQAQGGAQMAARLPMPTLVISGTFAAVGRAVMTLPACTLTASGTVGGTATARLTLPGGYAVTARTGAQAILAIAPYGYRLNGAGLAGGTASARLTLRGHYALNAHALAEAYARAVMTLPALRMTSGAVARMRLPKPIIRAVVTDRTFR